MKHINWWQKTIIIFVAWLLAILFEEDHSLSIGILLGGCFLVLYFCLPIIKRRVPVYFLLSCLVLLAQIIAFSPTNYFPYLFYYSLLIESATTGKMDWKLKLAIIVPSFTYVLFQGWSSLFIYHLCCLGLFLLVSYYLNTLFVLKRLRDEEWKSLLVEYRKTKRYVVAQENATRLQERTRIARDIHDSVGHHLTALMMQLTIAEHSSTKEDMKDHLVLSKELASTSLEDMRRAIKALKYDEEKGILSVLQLIRKLEAESHIRVALTTKTGVLSTNLTNEQSVVLYRFVQEGLTNAMRHAHSREINVVMEIAGNHTFIMTMENKVHETIGKIKEGFGLSNMRERFDHLNGNLQHYVINNKFVIKGTFPIKERAC